MVNFDDVIVNKIKSFFQKWCRHTSDCFFNIHLLKKYVFKNVFLFRKNGELVVPKKLPLVLVTLEWVQQFDWQRWWEKFRTIIFYRSF